MTILQDNDILHGVLLYLQEHSDSSYEIRLKKLPSQSCIIVSDRTPNQFISIFLWLEETELSYNWLGHSGFCDLNEPNSLQTFTNILYTQLESERQNSSSML